MRVERRTRRFVSALVLVTLLSITISPAFVRAADATVVFAALQVLRDRHVASPDPVKLLTAAANGLRQALSRAGIDQPLSALTGATEAAARAEFQAVFDRAAALAEGRVSQSELQYVAARAMAASLDDPHTSFLTPAQVAEETARQRGRAGYVGIGISFLPREGRYYIMRVFPGGPAARSGLRRFDRILSIDGRNPDGLQPDEVADRIRGPQGSNVTLAVKRPQQTDPLTLTIARAPITIPTVEAQVLEGAVGYVWYSQFIIGSASQFRSALEGLLRQRIRALVVDLRPNLGGNRREAVQMASLFLTEGLVLVVFESRTGGRRTFTTEGPPLVEPILRLILVVDDSTHSAAEVFSAGIQDHRRGRLVGSKTGGFGGAYDQFPLPSGAAINVTVERSFTSKGVNLDEGVRPDVAVDLALSDLDNGVDAPLQRALQLARE